MLNFKYFTYKLSRALRGLYASYHNEHVSTTVVWLKGFVTKFQIVTYIQSMAKTITLLSGTSSKNTANRIDYEF
jgi:hypothetical protein